MNGANPVNVSSPPPRPAAGPPPNHPTQSPPLHHPRPQPRPSPPPLSRVPSDPPPPISSQPQVGYSGIPEYTYGIYNSLCGILARHDYIQALVTHYKTQRDELRGTLQDFEHRLQEKSKDLDNAITFAKGLAVTLDKERADFAKEHEMATREQAAIQERAEEYRNALSDALGIKEELAHTVEEQRRSSAEEAGRFRDEIQRLQEENSKLLARPPTPPPPKSDDTLSVEKNNGDLSMVIPDFSPAVINWMRRERTVFREESARLKEEREKLLHSQKLAKDLDAAKTRNQSLEALVKTLRAAPKVDKQPKAEINHRKVELADAKDRAELLKNQLDAELKQSLELKTRIRFLEMEDSVLREALEAVMTRDKEREQILLDRSTEIGRLEALVEELKMKLKEAEEREARLREELEEAQHKMSATASSQSPRKTKGGHPWLIADFDSPTPPDHQPTDFSDDDLLLQSQDNSKKKSGPSHSAKPAAAKNPLRTPNSTAATREKKLKETKDQCDKVAVAVTSTGTVATSHIPGPSASAPSTPAGTLDNAPKISRRRGLVPSKTHRVSVKRRDGSIYLKPILVSGWIETPVRHSSKPVVKGQSQGASGESITSVSNSSPQDSLVKSTPSSKPEPTVSSSGGVSKGVKRKDGANSSEASAPPSKKTKRINTAASGYIYYGQPSSLQTGTE